MFEKVNRWMNNNKILSAIIIFVIFIMIFNAQKKTAFKDYVVSAEEGSLNAPLLGGGAAAAGGLLGLGLWPTLIIGAILFGPTLLSALGSNFHSLTDYNTGASSVPIYFWIIGIVFVLFIFMIMRKK